MGILGDVLGSVTGGLIGTDAAGDAAKLSAQGYNQGIAEQRRQFDTVLNLQAPTINTGNAARSLLASILGIEQPAYSFSPNATSAGTTTASPQASRPTSGAVNFYSSGRKNTQPVQAPSTPGLTFTSPASKPMSAAEIQSRLEAFPGYQFAVQQATDAAKGLGSATGSLGGNVVAALGERVGGQIAPSVFNDYLNRLSSLSGASQTASNTASGAALSTGANVAQGLQGAADARASGILGRNQNVGNFVSSLGSIFAGGLGGGGGGFGVPQQAIYNGYMNGW